jgi:hypothetical protein
MVIGDAGRFLYARRHLLSSFRRPCERALYVLVQLGEGVDFRPVVEAGTFLPRAASR